MAKVEGSLVQGQAAAVVPTNRVGFPGLRISKQRKSPLVRSTEKQARIGNLRGVQWAGAGSFGHALATGKDPWSEASLGVSTTSVRIASWYSKPLIFPGQLCMAKSSSPAAAVASLKQDSATLAGSMSRWPVWASAARTCERYHGLFSPGSRPTASSQTLSASPTGLRARWACGLMVLGTTKCLHETRAGRFSSASRSPLSLRRAKWSLKMHKTAQPGSACRWPQIFDTKVIRLRSMTLFNPVSNCLTP